MDSFQPNSTQGHFLLRLLILGEEPQKSKVKPSTFKKKDRDLLTAEGLIAEEKRGRAGHLVPNRPGVGLGEPALCRAGRADVSLKCRRCPGLGQKDRRLPGKQRDQPGRIRGTESLRGDGG